ncbi:hypothetical protein BJ122_104126 [Rhodopseudomonas faecalis]|uniref:LPP20 lipoprotein n=1 Tax=Rhodopseudomonas faecalis TaxID=99655 RepID=A0A318TK17_9BRAD|nr:hypothetical protein [Rhodopseudomonas faecalis]PYF04147.1 hypothetical protein BJ122_104126 [Rhodopseudomonas faecalis]
MVKIKPCLIACILLQLSIPVLAQSNVQLQELSPLPQKSSYQSIEACWSDWLSREGLQEGKNERDNYFILVSKQAAAISEPPDSRNWLTARQAMFAYAELEARKALAETIKTTIRSDRATAIKMMGGDNAPPSLKPAVEQLSLSDKALVLADKAVDAEIKKYDPKWSGTTAQRQEKIAKLQVTLNQNIASSAEVFASGAFSAVQCEGPSTEDSGKYAVLVGLIWSPKLQAIAEAIWDPSIIIPPAPPKVRLKSQFDEMAAVNPDWMAYTEGVRVYTDEKGSRVVVGFGVAPKTSLASADHGRARLHGLAAIQRFLGEKIVARSSASNRFERREFSDDSATSFDTSEYNSQITAVSKDLQLTGTADVGSWRGEHPWSKAGMQVVAVAWSQAWAADSQTIGDQMRTVEQRMRKQGAVPSAPGTSSEAVGGKSGPAATMAKPGARSTASDF